MSVHEFTVTAYGTAYGGYGDTSQHLERIQTFLDYVKGIEGKCLVPSDRLCTEVSPVIRRLQDNELDVGETERLMMQTASVAVLELSAQVGVSEAVAFENTIPFSPDRATIMKRIAEGRLREGAATLALATNLSMPGEMHFHAGKFGKDQSESGRGYSEFGGTVARDGRAWPPISRIPLSQVIEWLSALPGWNRGISGNGVSRGVAALSQALACDHDAGGSAVQLVWSMVGLEALYCRDRNGLRSQLIRHAQLLLGPMTHNNRKRFGKVYDYRSTFLHGGVEVPYAHREKNSPEDDVWRFIWDSDAEAGLAFTTLVATIQQLILRNAQSLEFVTELRTSSQVSAPNASSIEAVGEAAAEPDR